MWLPALSSTAAANPLFTSLKSERDPSKHELHGVPHMNGNTITATLVARTWHARATRIGQFQSCPTHNTRSFTQHLCTHVACTCCSCWPVPILPNTHRVFVHTTCCAFTPRDGAHRACTQVWYLKIHSEVDASLSLDGGKGLVIHMSSTPCKDNVKECGGAKMAAE
jgi:hypothetical protein